MLTFECPVPNTRDSAGLRSKKPMNKILKLFDEKFVLELFNDKLLPRYPDFLNIKKITIHPIKNGVWEETYHVVIEFKVIFNIKNGKTNKLSIFCSAHSDEPRKKSFEALNFLWQNGFANSRLSIPHPLFYSDYFNAFFYRGVKGDNLYQFIRKNDRQSIDNIIPKTAKWFAKLHNTPTITAKNFNEENSRIETVIPGTKNIFALIKKLYSHHYETYKRAYKYFIAKENSFLESTTKRWLVHGDAHPENIIKISANKIAVIDFTDICLADFARDIGTFLQQFEYMSLRKVNDKNYTDRIKNLFLDNYFKHAKIKLDSDLQKRINYYYNWTALRTATFFFLKYDAEPERGELLVKQVKKNWEYKSR